MSDLLSADTDYEAAKYDEAATIMDAGFNAEAIKSKKSVFNPEQGVNEILMPMQSGGYVQIGQQSLEVEASLPGAVLIDGIEYGPETAEYQRYYPKKDPAPAAMTEAPAMPAAPEAQADVDIDMGAQVRGVQDYAAQLRDIQGGFSEEDLTAAGYSPQVIQKAGLGVSQVEPIAPLSQEEIQQQLQQGTLSVFTSDPTLRESGSQALTATLTDIALNSLREDLEAEYVSQTGEAIPARGSAEYPRSIQETLRTRENELMGEAEVLSNAVFGHKSGIGVADFATAGIMDIQEGARLFSQGRAENKDSKVDRLLGTLLVAAGIAEATGVGMFVGKAIKKSLPSIRSAIEVVGERLNQPGPMPTTSSFGAGAIDDPVKQAKQAVLDNPGDKELLGEYTRLLKERSDVKDASAVARAAARGDVAVAEPPTETEPGIIAFHGSGADFDQFKLDKINTGEGAQAFGYGLYFTDSENIAEFYKSAVRQAKDLREGYDVTYKGKPFINLGDTPEAEAQGYEYSSINKIIDRLNKVTTVETKQLPQPQLIQLAKDRAIKDTEREIEITKLTYPTADIVEGSGFDEISQIILDSLNDELDALKAIDANDLSFSTGKTYQVGLDVKPDELLDYDKPFDEQTPFVQRAIAKVLNEITIDDAFNLGVDLFSPPYNGNTEMAIRDAQKLMLDNFTAVRFLNDWSVLRGFENSGEELLEKHGVKGIKYKANRGPGSRNVPETGSDNYVIFDDRLIQILKKYGIVGPVAVTAMSVQRDNEEET